MRNKKKKDEKDPRCVWCNRNRYRRNKKFCRVKCRVEYNKFNKK